MKIVHVVEAWKGGIASYVESLVNKQLEDGHDVTIIADADSFLLDKRDIKCNIITYNASRNPIKIIPISRLISNKIEKLKPNVVHAHSTFAGIYARTFNLNGIKYFYSPHSWSFSKSDVSFFSKVLYKMVERYLSKYTNKILCISREEIELGLNAGISKEKLNLIYTGIPDLTTKYLNQPDEFDSVRRIKVGFIGRLDYQKGYDILVQSEKDIDFSKIEIHIYGNAVRNEDSVIYPDNFNIHGWIENNKIPEIINELDIIIIPSRWEGFALTPLEAMRAAKPVIVSNWSSLPEVVITGFNGIVLNELNPYYISLALNNLSLEQVKYMGGNARKVFEKTFTFDKYYLDIMRQYK